MTAPHPNRAGPFLVIDTAGPGSAVAVISAGRVLAEAADAEPRGQAERLIGLIDRVISSAGLTRGEIGAVVACTGPGGFTGVRAGVAAARGLALGLGVPAIGVDRFEALAYGSRGPRTVVLAVGGRALARAFRDGRAEGAAHETVPAETPDSVAAATPARLAAVAAAGGGCVPAAPLYLRAPDALPSRHMPPPLLE